MLELGLDPATGKRRQQMKGGFRTKKEAQAALRAVGVASDEGRHVTTSKMTVSTFVAEWLVNIAPTLKATSHSGYSRSAKHITKALGSRPLQMLTALEVESFYARLLVDGHMRGGGLSAKSVRNVHVTLRKALADAERLGLVTRNVASSARPPTAKRFEQTTWSSEELREFLASVDSDRLVAVWKLIATTGMRRGEALGLQWAHVDFDDGCIAVVQSLTTADNIMIFSEPKTPKSRRRISLDHNTLEGLRQHRVAQKAQRLAVGSVWENQRGLVFTDPVGEPLHPDWFSREFTRLSRAAGLPNIRLHDLRHTYATLALKAGVHPKVVSERLGHATIGITLDLYSHVSKGLDSEAAELVAGKIFGDT